MSAQDCGKNMNAWADRKRAGLHAILQVIGHGTLQAYAQAKAPWKDRTGNARQGLHGGAFSEKNAEVLYIAHTMEYGIYLEKGFAGRYAILKPTIEAHLEHVRKVVTPFWRD